MDSIDQFKKSLGEPEPLQDSLYTEPDNLLSDIAEFAYCSMQSKNNNKTLNKNINPTEYKPIEASNNFNAHKHSDTSNTTETISAIKVKNNIENIDIDSIISRKNLDKASFKDDVDTIFGGRNNDILRGDAGNDLIRAGKGKDSLQGGDGADSLVGGKGRDFLDGGVGDDVYYIDMPGDIIFENNDGGVDTVMASSSYALSKNVENIVLEDSNYDIVTLNGQRVQLYGNPSEWGSRLDYYQGDNLLGYKGNCGIVACENILIQSGNFDPKNNYTPGFGSVDNLESAIVKDVSSKGMCLTTGSSKQKGGTTQYDQEAILESYGVSAHVESVSLESIASYIKKGHGVIVEVNSADFWSTSNFDGKANHAVVLTGVACDVNNSDEIKGFYVCDSGRGRSDDAARYVSLEEMESSYYYSSQKTGIAVITDAAVVESYADINAVGNDLDNLVIGNSANNKLNGKGGDDTLTGNQGNDLLKGCKGSDSLLGGEGDDILKGGSGNDTLNAGIGDDYLRGDKDSDTYIFTDENHGHDLIKDKSGDNDILDLSELYTINDLLNSAFAFDFDKDGVFDSLKLNFDSANNITILNYFEEGSMSSGDGLVENISCSNGVLDFDDIMNAI